MLLNMVSVQAEEQQMPYFLVKMLLEKSWEWGIDKYALFIDLEKAFDRLDW